MIKIVRGDIFESEAEYLVNTVNCVGVWGKGLALEFKKRFPESYEYHRSACKDGLVKIGSMFVFRHLVTPHVICFPTKEHWQNPSKIEWIKTGLRSLKRVIWVNSIKSIAIPALGCTNGGLSFEKDVLPLMMKELSVCKRTDIEIYCPID